ncbi:MAG TPA: MFS transporter [Candidatus Acidoferrales bacterium]|nr:MFS transporter [Candidatus Acidoferrales bacterium]
MTLALANVPATAQRKIARRLLPFLCLLYVLAYIDRVNVGFAGLDMTRALHFSNEAFGFGAGIFFFGYCLLQIPGAMAAQSWSSRKWIAAVMIGWGMLASLTGFIQTSTQFSVIRFLLGLAEGGFFPAVVVYLTHWFRQEDRAKAVAMFMAAIPASAMIGGPIAGRLLSLNWLGVPGWRWLFMLEGIPALIGGIATLLFLTDWPKDARWLSPGEREWITEELGRENHEKEKSPPPTSTLRGLGSPLVLALAFSYFSINIAGYGLVMWLPKMVQKFSGITTWQVSLVASIPFLCGIPAMLITGWHSDRTGERKWHAIIATLAAAAGLAISQLAGASPPVVVAGFSIAAMGIYSYYPPYWTLPTKLLSVGAAAAAYGFINMIANLGGFVGPYAIGFLTDLTGTYVAGVLLLVTSAIISGVTLACLRMRADPNRGEFAEETVMAIPPR